jgi:hypothetical protein
MISGIRNRSLSKPLATRSRETRPINQPSGCARITITPSSVSSTLDTSRLVKPKTLQAGQFPRAFGQLDPRRIVDHAESDDDRQRNIDSDADADVFLDDCPEPLQRNPLQGHRCNRRGLLDLVIEILSLDSSTITRAPDICLPSPDSRSSASRLMLAFSPT